MQSSNMKGLIRCYKEDAHHRSCERRLIIGMTTEYSLLSKAVPMIGFFIQAKNHSGIQTELSSHCAIMTKWCQKVKEKAQFPLC